MIRFIVRTEEERQRLSRVIASHVVGGSMSCGTPPKYFIYYPITRRLREVGETTYTHGFFHIEAVPLERFEQMAGAHIVES